MTGLTQAFASKNVLGTNGSTLAVTGYTINDGNGGNDYTVTTATRHRHDHAGGADDHGDEPTPRSTTARPLRRPTPTYTGLLTGRRHA